MCGIKKTKYIIRKIVNKSMKNLNKILLVSILFLTSCVSVRVRPVFLPSTPLSLYNVNGISLGVNTECDWFEFTYKKFNLEKDLHLGFSSYYYNDKYNKFEKNDKLSSAGIFLFSKFWWKLKNKKYPFANFYVGLQPSFVLYKDRINEYYLEKDYYYPMTLDFGFCPGIYREKYNVSLSFRGGGGFIFPKGSFIHTGLGLQSNVFIFKNLGCGFNLEMIVGAGGVELKKNKSAAVIALAPIGKVYLMFKF